MNDMTDQYVMLGGVVGFALKELLTRGDPHNFEIHHVTKKSHTRITRGGKDGWICVEERHGDYDLNKTSAKLAENALGREITVILYGSEYCK